MVQFIFMVFILITYLLFVSVMFSLYLPIRSEVNYLKVSIKLFVIVIYFTSFITVQGLLILIKLVVLTIQHSKCSIFHIVLFQINQYHQYLYPLLIICFCHVFLIFAHKIRGKLSKGID